MVGAEKNPLQASVGKKGETLGQAYHNPLYENLENNERKQEKGNLTDEVLCGRRDNWFRRELEINLHNPVQHSEME